MTAFSVMFDSIFELLEKLREMLPTSCVSVSLFKENKSLLDVI